MMRRTHIEAIADERHAVDGVAVVGSYQMRPESRKPYKVRGVSFTDKTERSIEIRLSEAEARKLVRDFRSFGLSDA